jgi:hypothetical protein
MHPILQKQKGLAAAFGQRSREALAKAWKLTGLLAFGSLASCSDRITACAELQARTGF